MDKNNDKKHLAKANATAWDQLYRNTRDSVWGREPVAFLADFLPDIREALNHHGWMLDAGSGEGRNLAPFLELEGHICAVDSSVHALSKMTQALSRETAAIQADLASMPFQTGSFQAVLLIDIIETMPDPQRILTEIFRILAPAGILVTNIPCLDDSVAGIDMTPLNSGGYLYQEQFFYHFFSQDSACDLLKHVGFDILRMTQHRWLEAPHPGFRDYPHEHMSWVLLAQKDPGNRI